MENHSLCIAHVVLQLAQQRHGSGSRHRLKHILLPVLTHRLHFLGNVCRQVRSNSFLLVIVRCHLQHLITIVVDGVEQFLAATTTGSQHHLGSSFQVFLVTDISHVTIVTVGFADNSQFQFVGKVIELVAHLLHLLRLIIPLLHLLGILLHLHGKVVVDGQILLRGIDGGTFQTFLHQREAVEHLVRDVQRQHSHQYDVHQVNHLLTW